MHYWKKLSHAEQDKYITRALAKNIDFSNKISLGIPASKLDALVFPEAASFLKDAPLLRSYVQNPNHIGCHTEGSSENFFAGTQEIERQVIEILSVDLLKAAPNSCDGYIAGGGTEANIQAIWMYRNYFIRAMGFTHDEIALLTSEDTHYSIAKAANLLGLKWFPVPVDYKTRELLKEELESIIDNAMQDGIKGFIVVANMATTMFGSVDNPELYVRALEKRSLPFKMHIDGAFGGFIYPVSHPGNLLSFLNPYVTSITLDAHKMLQAPYGTGVFLTRKNYIQNVLTKEAQYVHGMDVTLSGSRSGANAIAVWMILSTYGPFGYMEKINKLLYRTAYCCSELDNLDIPYYRHPHMNIIAIEASYIPGELSIKYGLVPDSHEQNPRWYKIVVMEHVGMDEIQRFISDLKKINVAV